MIIVSFVCICELMRAAVASLTSQLQALSVLAADASSPESFRTTSEATEQYMFAYYRLTRAVEAVCTDWQLPVFLVMLLTSAVFVGLVMDVLAGLHAMGLITQVLRSQLAAAALSHSKVRLLRLSCALRFDAGHMDTCLWPRPARTSPLFVEWCLVLRSVSLSL